VHCARLLLLLVLLLPVLQQPPPLHLRALLLAVLGERDTSKQCHLAGLASPQGVSQSATHLTPTHLALLLLLLLVVLMQLV
jgi:hypothetical protein